MKSNFLRFVHLVLFVNRPKSRCTIVNGTPTMHIDLIAKQNELNLPIKTTEIAITGGAACSPQLFRNIKSTFGLRSVKVWLTVRILYEKEIFNLHAHFIISRPCLV